MLRQQVKYNTIEIARLSRGIGQEDLSEKMGITQGTLSKIESGILAISKEHLEKLVTTLNYPASFFYEEIVIPPAFAIHYRKKKTISGIELQKIQYSIYIMKHFVKKLLKAVKIKSNLFYLSPDEYGDPETIAGILRNKWNIPRGPIKNLMNLVEAAGVVILLVEYDNKDIDGEVVPDQDGLPVIYINKNMPPDRMRFTLAHELGHLIMHNGDYIVPGEIAEKEANAFASEFLMPSEDIRYQMDDRINITRLADLKRYWKVSMASLIMTAERVGVNSKTTKSLWAQLYKAGYKFQEPDLSLLKEQPTIVQQTFNIYFEKLNYSIDDFAKIITIHKSEIRNLINLYSTPSSNVIKMYA